MDDLFKNIKDNLENRPEPSFDERAWQDMENRLDKKTWYGAALFAWALPLALAALFLTNIFFFKKLNDANKKISNIELRADTIYQTNYIYEYDTIYRQRVEKEYVVMGQQRRVEYFSSQSPYFDYPSEYYSQRSSLRNTTQNRMTFADLQYMFADDQHENEASLLVKNPQVEENIGLHVSPFLTSNYSLLDVPAEDVKLAYLAIPAEQRKKKRPFQKLGTSLQPTGFEAGILGGFAFPQHDQVAETKGFSVGAYGSISFFDNFRMWAEASYYNVEFKSEEMGESLGIPEIEVPDDDYEFYEASVHQPFMQYTFGLQYIFAPKNKWRPYLGVGYTFASMLPYEVSYDFHHITDDIELSIEESINRKESISNMVLFNGGIEGNLSDRIGIKLEGYFRWNGNQEGLIVTNVYGIRSLLFYKF